MRRVYYMDAILNSEDDNLIGTDAVLRDSLFHTREVNILIHLYL